MGSISLSGLMEGSDDPPTEVIRLKKAEQHGPHDHQALARRKAGHEYVCPHHHSSSSSTQILHVKKVLHGKKEDSMARFRV
jgi:hypothetical protein